MRERRHVEKGLVRGRWLEPRRRLESFNDAACTLTAILPSARRSSF